MMNAEALIGTVLGTCTLQRLIGQGGMGAVYLAQQSRPRRLVAVKVLLPATTLKPHQLPAFLERFRRETDAAASLEHPNIMPVHEYGEQDNLAYLVMPYIRGGTLRDVMEQEGLLEFPQAVGYLEQMAAALDFAHARGVIHRDVKPANMLLTPEGRLLLTDFGLVKVIAGGQTEQIRLTGAGAPVGTPDYMSPEQVMGNEVDGRADLYSLGIILYQMVTGVTPFQGETPMQIAAQHLQMSPTSPHTFRTDLPPAVEQVILQALAKRPADRYARGHEMVAAFRFALASSEVQFNDVGSPLLTSNTSTCLFTPRVLFEPNQQTGAVPAMSNDMQNIHPTGSLPAAPKRATGLLTSYKTGIPVAGRANQSQTPAAAHPGSATDSTKGQTDYTGPQQAFPQAIEQMSPIFNITTTNIPSPATPPEELSPSTSTQPAVFPLGLNQMSPALNPTTGALPVPHAAAPVDAGAVKLTGPMKIVQMPIAGQPGQYMTGLLPVFPAMLSQAPVQKPQGKVPMFIALAALALMVILGAGALWWMHSHSITAVPTRPGAGSTIATTAPDLMATATSVASATAQANTLLTDPLSQNFHNWPTSPGNVYSFTNGAYHITDRGNDGIAVVLQVNPFTGPIGYTLTMNEVRGNDASASNSFGMIIRFSQQTKGGKNITTFYSFEVVNTTDSKNQFYRFYKYDNSHGSAINPWTELWHQTFGKEFHQGQGPTHVNTFKIFANGNTFTFTVNGKVIGTYKDGSFQTGTVGMLINLSGTEIAFSNLVITRN